MSQAIEWEVEQDMKPLWIMRYVMDSISGETTVQFSEFMKSIETVAAPEITSVKTAEEIIAAAMPFVEADRKRRKEAPGG